MLLKKVTLLMLLGIFYNFAKLLYFTFNPAYSPVISLSNFLLSLFAHIFIISFFITFSREFVDPQQDSLMNATIGAVVSSVALLVLDFVNNLGSVMSTYWTQDQVLEYVTILVYWLNSLILVYFFYILFIAPGATRSIKMHKATLFAFYGAIAATIMHSLNLVNYFYLMRLHVSFWSNDMPGAQITGGILILFYFSAISVFLITLYKEKTPNR
ncbi:MAG: hypothetical protein K9N06_12650 [Candidatus Cloacimonetes bacterium]|nr:hypothetical protein [Candidatus Cloacimonadota bacterium]